MDNLEIFNLYEKKTNSQSESFKNEIDSILKVKTDYQKKTLDLKWIEILEEGTPYLDNIFRNPNRFIVNEEEIKKIELVRKITVDSIKHLSKNTNLIQDIDEKTGDVMPAKLLNINKEEDYNTYENRLIYTLIQNMKYFISKKKQNLEDQIESKEKNDKQIEYTANSKIENQDVSITMKVNTKLNSEIKKENSVEEILERIIRLEQKVADITGSDTYKIIDKKHITLISPPIRKTNLILKNVNFQYAMKLWDYLQSNLEDDTEEINEKKDYFDENNTKKMADDIFLLNYFLVDTLDKSNEEDADEQEENEKQIQTREELTNQLIEKIIDLNSNLTEEKLKELIGSKYVIVKYKKLTSINELQKIFKTHIEKYLSKI